MDTELKILLAIIAVIIIWCIWTKQSTHKPKTSESFASDVSPEVQPEMQNMNQVNDQMDYESMYMLDDGTRGDAGLGYNMCSMSCCGAQYPTPFPVPSDPLVCGSEQEFVPSSYSCRSNKQNAGCLCMTKEQSEFLGSRGGNA